MNSKPVIAKDAMICSHDTLVVVPMIQRKICRITSVAAVLLSLLFASNPSPAAPVGGDASTDARANAKAAMMLAIEELQQSAGPDQRVTARADILDENTVNPKLTGVWDSWEISATAPPAVWDYERPAKDARFHRWLVSNPDSQAVRKVALAGQPLANPATLWGAGTLGDTAPVSSYVAAAKVPVTSPSGAYAWAVLDEGVKVRINTPYTDDATTVAAKTLQLGSGERPGLEFIPGLATLRRTFFRSDTSQFSDFTKGIGDANFSITSAHLAPGSTDILKLLTHDVSLHSMGLFTDTAHGGLRKDFHLLTNTSSLPAEYSGSGVYSSRLKLPVSQTSNPSDPTWASLQQYARLYRDKVKSSGGVPVISAQAPSSWAAATTDGTTSTLNITPPPGVVLQPTIAKVQMLFSLVGRDIYRGLLENSITRQLTATEKNNYLHNPQAGNFAATKYDYDLHLVYMPIITLHNPYNVALEFTSVRVEFANVPFAMQIFRKAPAETSFVAQSTGLVPFDTMFLSYSTGKLFGMNLKTKVNGVPGPTTFRLLPGEVKLFTPYLDPARTYEQEFLSNRTFFDHDVYSSFTTNMDTIPGWRGGGVGFDCDWLAGDKAVDGLAANGHWASCLGLAWDDQIYVRFAPVSIPLGNNKFVVKMSTTVGGTTTVVNAIEMDYNSASELQSSILGQDGSLRYPSTSEYIMGYELVDRATTPVSQLIHAKPFALLSLQAKTSSSGRYASSNDGRYATKPWCFTHANIGASIQNVVKENSANFSHELSLIRVDNGLLDDYLSIDSQDRSNFVTGFTPINGTKFGLQYEIPLAPLQTLAGLNGANPGGSSGYLPRFAQPIGNSWAHPLMSPTHLMETNAASGYNYLDHSFLLNLALYDGYYFSGLADQSGAFGTGKSTNSLASGFASGTPLDDPRLLLYRPNGKTSAFFADEAAKPLGYANIAAWQMMRGAFNINSTSVPAWKAMLASIHDSQALYNQLNKSNNSSALTSLISTSAGEARISRFRLPAAISAADGGDGHDAYWLGPREYSDAQLQTLAENIVKQVRLRGPFLSLAEFVNRRLGIGESAQRGALQQAIDDSNLNQAIAATANAGFEIPLSSVTNYRYVNPAAGAGSSYQGAPGYLTQADLLNVLGNAASARSDTFTIRAYGEAHDGSGNITSSAICEAVVQRLPDWYDPADLAETSPASLVSAANRMLGRRFRVISFRWLAPGEI